MSNINKNISKTAFPQAGFKRTFGYSSCKDTSLPGGKPLRIDSTVKKKLKHIWK
jgi:hypothetical protein